ncbi:helix-turn-helix domain-containing protein [Streptomyces sioyaensis]|uniref:helix-turn-helix domain-containing protein n=1 Tax=Streptomyces sioyaensis TaxID=67364 RepID=UPI0037A52D5A
MSAHIGKRLRDIRKRRGMSQRELAKGSGVSLSLIRKLEQGERAVTRLETARQLAVALGVPTTQLVAEEAADREPDGVTVDQWGGVRRALLAPGPSDDLDEPPTVAGLRAAVESAQPLFSGDKLAELSSVLPPLIRDAEAVAESGPEGRAVHMRVMQLTGWLLLHWAASLRRTAISCVPSDL